MVTISKLTPVPPRQTWNNEAYDFTPWLADNLDYLSEALGLSLELVDREVNVQGFSADILARESLSDKTVLIENQLEKTDHKHLGQIMTYLAGVEAQIVIWIATAFHEAHREAIKWLNENSLEDFSFYAVELSTVRIGDSAIAPILDVVERPNEWARHVREEKRERVRSPKISQAREAYWTAYLERYPDSANWGMKAYQVPSVWCPVEGMDTEANLSLWVSAEKSGIFLRAGRGENVEPLREMLMPFQ